MMQNSGLMAHYQSDGYIYSRIKDLTQPYIVKIFFHITCALCVYACVCVCMCVCVCVCVCVFVCVCACAWVVCK